MEWGSLDEIKVYPYAISESEVEQLYQQGKSHVATSTDSSSSTDLKDGLVLSQTFDRIETCGQSDTIGCPSGMSGEIAVDESNEANHGELMNGPTQADAEDCRVGNCLKLDEGDSEYVHASDSSSLNVTGNITVSGWMKSQYDWGSSPSVRGLLDKDDGSDGYRLEVKKNGKTRFVVCKDGSCGTTDRNSGLSAEAGEWTHVVGKFNGTHVVTYMDAEQDEMETASGLGKVSEGLEIGRFNDQNSRTFDGKLDQFRIYNRSLSKKEIWKLYTQGRDRSNGAGGPVAHYPIQAEASPLRDISGEENNGDLDLLGETGTFNTSNGEWKTVRFERSYENPVLVGTTNTKSGENAVAFQARNVQSNKAEVRLCESEGSVEKGCDTHGTERGGYIVVDANSMDSYTGIEAGSFKIDSDIDSNTHSESYSEGFSSTPMVFFTVMTDNGDGPVTAWPTSTDSNGFTAGICEQESNNACNSGHPEEEVAWIALEPGNLPFKQQAETGSLGTTGSSNWVTADYTDFVDRPVGLFDVQDNSGGQDPKIDEIRNLDQQSMEVRFCELDGSESCDGHASMEYAYFAAEEGLLTNTTGNSPQYVDTERGKALKFDGNDDRVKTELIDSLQEDSFSVSFWMNPDSAGDGQRLVYKDESNGGWAVSYGDPGSGKLRFYIRGLDDISLDTGDVINSGKWHHVTAVRDAENNNRYIYVNGAEKASLNSDSGSLSASNDELVVGAQNDGSKSFNGNIDNIRIYPYALSAEEVKKIKSQGGISVG